MGSAVTGALPPLDEPTIDESTAAAALAPVSATEPGDDPMHATATGRGVAPAPRPHNHRPDAQGKCKRSDGPHEAQQGDLQRRPHEAQQDDLQRRSLSVPMATTGTTALCRHQRRSATIRGLIHRPRYQGHAMHHLALTDSTSGTPTPSDSLEASSQLRLLITQGSRPYEPSGPTRRDA